MTAAHSNILAPKPMGVMELPTDKLKPNPHNPRLLFDREPLEILKSSIAKVGILVPLTVYRTKKTKQYFILDGQRRWMCARDLQLTQVPVNVVSEPSLVQNIVTMFQIHKLRQDWELMPTALKLEVLMNALRERSEKKLAELTGLDQAVVSRCKKLLSYPKKYQDQMLDPDPAKRVKADFFIELYAVRNDREVNKMEWFSKEKFTERMLDKYQRQKGLKAVTDFRIIKQHISNAVKANKQPTISRRLKEFTYDDNLAVDSLIIDSADVSAKAKRLLVQVEKLTADLHELEVEAYYGEERLWRSLESLVELLKAKLAEADRRPKK